MSATVPNLANGGDRETTDLLRPKYGFCKDDQIIDINCRVIGQRAVNFFFGQNVTCDANTGLLCLNSNQGLNGECMDYEISYFCNCKYFFAKLFVICCDNNNGYAVVLFNSSSISSF